MDRWSGQSIGRYHIIEPLGEGGMAVVYKAFDTRLESDVAVKFIRRERIPPEELEHMLQRFEREAKALARLTHPNIVKVIDFGAHEDWPYLVMPFLPGGTLKQRLGKPILYTEAARLLAPIARALAYAHDRGILHRDVKPANILITESGEPMLADFGIAKIFDQGAGQTLTGTGAGIGTPEYMAPEQWMNHVSPQTDIYALGVVFYEMVAGRKPYDADTPAAILLMQAHDPLPRPSQFNIHLSETVEKVLFKALAKQPGDRYAAMAEFALVLDKLSVDVITTQPEPQESQGKTAQQRFPPPTYPKEERIPARRIPIAAVLGAMLFLVLLVFGGWALWDRRSEASAQAQLATLTSTQPARRPTNTPSQTPTRTPIPSTPTDIPPTATRTAIPPTPTPKLRAGVTRVAAQDKMVQVYVPRGAFSMGSTEAQMAGVKFICTTCDWLAYERPQHKVDLDAFWMDRTEVTNAMYSMCVEAGDCKPLPGRTSNRRNNYYGNPDFDNYPVVWISWDDARSYCEWAGRRLPTEAEWEYAARGGLEDKLFPWGNDQPVCTLGASDGAQFLNCGLNDTLEVASFAPNGYGIYDLSGNVWEWLSSLYYTYPYNSADGREDMSTDGKRAMRGGSWENHMDFIRLASRNGKETTYRNNNTGFRCASSK